MSYDVYFEIDTGAGEVAGVGCRNYTSNAGEMWSRALKIEGQNPGWGSFAQFDYGLAELIKRTPKATDLGPIVRAAVTSMRNAGQAAYADLEPGNGWGNYEGALNYLEWIADMCERHPGCTVRVSA